MYKESKTRASSSRARARIVENTSTEQTISGGTEKRIKETLSSKENYTTVEIRATGKFIVVSKIKKKHMMWTTFFRSNIMWRSL